MPVRILLINFILLSLHFTITAQTSNQVQLQWMVNENYEAAKSPKFTFTNANHDANQNYPSYDTKIMVPNGASDIEVKISNIKLLQDASIPATSDKQFLNDIQVKLATEKRQRYALISFSPFQLVDDIYIPIKSFDINIEIKNNSNNSNRGPFTTNSQLADGEIVKFSISANGIYSINHSFLQEAGINPSDINPDKLIILGQGGGYLADANDQARIDDLTEIGTFRKGLNDGSFDEGDEILFYGEGSDNILIEDNAYSYQKNIYSTDNYYFLKVGDENYTPLNQQSNITDPSNTYSHGTNIQRYEIDKINLLGDFASTEGSGKRWFGDQYFNTTNYDYTNQFDFSNTLLDKPIAMKALFAGRSNNTTKVKFNIGDIELSKNMNATNVGEVSDTYAIKAIFDEDISPNVLNSVEVEYIKNNDSEAKGWIDYLELSTEDKLVYENKPLMIRQKSMYNHGSTGFRIESNKDDLIIWDVTNTAQCINHGYLSQNNVVSFGSNNNNQLREYIVFDPNNQYSQPSFVSSVNNQNLHGIDRLDYLIVSYKDFLPQAERLADFYRERSDAEIAVVDVDLIFNEFSSGKLDPTAIRDFVKMIYERDDQFNYLLLFGDGSYDQRNLDEQLGFKNFIPVYESDESLAPIYAYPSDDYFALLDEDEGGVLKDGLLDVSVGRLPVNNITEATTVVDKLIHYQSSKSTLGPWRTFISFAADDEDGVLHIGDANSIAEDTEVHSPLYNQKKVYYDAYPQETTPGGERYPGVTKDLIKNIENGLLVQCYLGHGGPTGWAQERVLQSNHIQDLHNPDKLTLMVTATCSFAGYDDPHIVSAGEHAVLNPSGAAVSLLTTTRAVFTTGNKRLTEAVFDRLFVKEAGQINRLGEVMRSAKNEESSENSRKFSLIGDPFMYLNVPKHDIVLTQFNEKPIEASFTDTIKALQTVSLEGRVQDYNGQLLEDFNGELTAIVYDKETETTTLRNNIGSGSYTFNQRKNILFKGRASVTNGLFKLTFLLPKDIDFSYGEGRISLYATDQITDAAGSFSDFIVGGSSENEISDNEGPVIDLYMNDESFVYGGTTNSEPIFLAKLSDENGINISGTSIGHDLSANLDRDEQNPLIMNEYYEAALDDYTSGSIRFPMDQLEPGKHHIELTAWDNLNNSNSGILEFVVINGDGEGLQHVLNYPNPFSTSTEFMFEHDLAGSNISILIKIFSLSGKLLKTIDTYSQSTGFRESNIMWDGRDDFGNRLANGVYLYQVSIHDQMLETSRQSDFEKLVIIN